MDKYLKNLTRKENLSKDFDIVTIVLGLIILIVMIYVFKNTSFFVGQLKWWKYLIIIPMFPISIILGIGVPFSLGNYIKHKLKNYGMFEDKADLISIIVVFIIIGIFYYWIR